MRRTKIANRIDRVDNHRPVGDQINRFVARGRRVEKRRIVDCAYLIGRLDAWSTGGAPHVTAPEV
jgi:hypothetical protein